VPRRRLALIVLLVTAIVASTWAGVRASRPAEGNTAWGRAPSEVRAVMWPEAQPLADFSLRTQHGAAFGPEALQGRWSFVVFGYLDCPDVCPIGLRALRGMRDRLADRSEGDEYQFIFVSVDPENDSPGEIGEYLASHGGGFTGLHGPVAEIGKLAEAMAVKHREVADRSGGRSIDHTSSVMVIDPQGRLVGALPPPLRPEHMVEQFERLRAYLRAE
jgi:protein SCO1